MRVLLRNLWLLLAGAAGWAAHLWVESRNERLIPLSDTQRALAPLGLALTVGCFALYFLCALGRKDLLAWLLPTRWHLGQHRAPTEARLLRLAATLPALGGLFYLAINAALLVMASPWPQENFAARRWQALAKPTLRLDVRGLAEDLPPRTRRLALALEAGRSDAQDLMDGEMLAYELFPIRSERYWIDSCTQGLGPAGRARVDAIIYQCDRADAYGWRPASRPTPKEP